MISFIPNYRIFRQGIIRNIPIDLDLEELKSGIDSPANVIAIRRLNRRISSKNDSGNNTVEFVPSKSIILNFQNQILSKYIFIFNVRQEVTPFVPKTTICFSCFRFGHAATRCRGKSRCSHCGLQDRDSFDSCSKKDSPPCCANCKEEHSPLDPLCPEFKIQKNVQLLAAERNILLKDAKELLAGNNPISLLHDDLQNFPVLSNTPLQETSGYPSLEFPLNPPLIPRSSLLSKGITYASTVSSPKFLRLVNKPSNSKGNRNHNPADSHPSLNLHTPDHDYLFEPNERPLLNPPNGCAIPEELSITLTSPLLPSDSLGNQLNYLSRLIMQLFATVSQFNMTTPQNLNSHFTQFHFPSILTPIPNNLQNIHSSQPQ